VLPKSNPPSSVLSLPEGPNPLAQRNSNPVPNGLILE